MKKFRHIYDKYVHGSAAAAAVLHQKTGLIHALLTLLEREIAEFEKIDVHEWFAERFYIVIEDQRPGWPDPVEASRMGFTVDIVADKILWCNDPLKPGNCFVRTSRWKSWLMKSFDGVLIEKIHWYKNCYLPKEAAK